MAFFSKILHFLKNIHPIRNFAKPIARQTQSQNYTVAASFGSVPISYEALKEEVIETPHHLEVEQTPTFSLEQSFSTFAPEVEQEQEMHGEEYVAPVVVMRKLEVRPEESLVLASDIEEPLAPDTVIGDIVDLSQFQTEPQPAFAEEMEKIIAQDSEEATPIVEEVNMVIAEAEIAPVTTEEVVEKKTRKRAPKATTTKKSVKAKTTKAKISANKVKKVTKAPAPKKRVSRKKTSVPQEAMGFGF